MYNKPAKTKLSAKDIQDQDSQTVMTVFAAIVRLCVAVSKMSCSNEIKDQLCTTPTVSLTGLQRVLSVSTKKTKFVLKYIPMRSRFSEDCP